MMGRPEDAAALRKEARENMKKLYAVLREEKGMRHRLTVLQDPACDHEIVLYPCYRDAAEKAEKLLKNYEKPMNQAIRDLKITENGLLWLFSSEKQKKKAFASYRYLTDAMFLGFGPAFREATELLEGALSRYGADCKKEYRENFAFYHGKLLALRKEAESIHK